MESLLFFAALVVFFFGLVSALADRSPVTAPMVFVAVGILAGPMGTGLVEGEIDSEVVKIVAEVTLALILFTDASTFRHKALRKDYRIPLRLLALGLPLTMALGLGAAVLTFPEMGIWLAAAMAFILAPTDAALGQAVVANEGVPENVRDAIGVESGLNDGIALPPLLACMAALAAAPEAGLEVAHWIGFTAKQIAFGPLTGAAIGLLGGWLIDRTVRRGWMEPLFQRLSSISLALVAYGLAEHLGGNGFLAAFFCGLMLGTRMPVVRSRIQDFGEAEGLLLSFFVFLIFGIVLVPKAVALWDARALGYALLSLTVIRMVPVAVSLAGSGLDRRAVGFIAWFGPRGIASILYLLVFLEARGAKGHEQMLAVIVLTVLLSIFLHGATAVPLANRYARAARLSGKGELAEP